jgi:hypothetical protein
MCISDAKSRDSRTNAPNMYTSMMKLFQILATVPRKCLTLDKVYSTSSLTATIMYTHETCIVIPAHTDTGSESGYDSGISTRLPCS